MLTGLYAKLIGLGLTLAALAGVFLWGHHAGAASVQARWDVAKVAQGAAVDRQAAQSAVQTLDWAHQFQTINSHYEGSAHEPTPAVADSVAAAASAGTIRLRDSADRCPGRVSGTAARSHAADAAATAALAQRVADSIAAVRVGDAADARERQLGEQVKALQAIVRAERTPVAAHP